MRLLRNLFDGIRSHRSEFLTKLMKMISSMDFSCQKEPYYWPIFGISPFLSISPSFFISDTACRAYNNDPSIYRNPSEFKPEHFLATGDVGIALDPYDVSFGFGRRICPGRLIVDTSLFLTLAHSLAFFDIKRSVGLDGREINPEVEFTKGIHKGNHQPSKIIQVSLHNSQSRAPESNCEFSEDFNVLSCSRRSSSVSPK